MKYIKLFTATVIVIGLIIFGTGKVFGQLSLPKITTACESKTGILYGFNDGFSIMKKCSNNNRRVVLIGEQGPKGDKGDQGDQGEQGIQGVQGLQGQRGVSGAGNIAFIFVDSDTHLYVLTTDKKVWGRSGDAWNDANREVPMDTSDIVQFNIYYLLDTNGDVWIYNGTQWVNNGHP